MTDASNTVNPSIGVRIHPQSPSAQTVGPDAFTEKKAPPTHRELPPTQPKEKLVYFESIRKSLADAIAALNDQIEKNGRGLKFSIDDTINRHIIIVSNTQTGEVVRQIPTEVVVRLAHSIEEIKGLLSDEIV